MVDGTLVRTMNPKGSWGRVLQMNTALNPDNVYHIYHDSSNSRLQ